MKRRKRRGLRGMEAQAWGGEKSFTPKAKKAKVGWCVWKGDKKVSCHTNKSAANKAAARKVKHTAKTCARMFKKVFKVKKRAA
jgi:hypothetical protein